MRSGRLRTLLGALSTIVLVGWASTGPRASDAAASGDPIADDRLASADAPADARDVSEDAASARAQAEEHEPAMVLRGLSGAATALTIGDAERVAEWLRGRGIDAAAYTSKTEPEERERVEGALRANELKVVVATTAFAR